MSTSTGEYAERLRSLQTQRWKRLFRLRAPYMWNVRRQGLGRTLDVGCGIGRNLQALSRDSVGVDHNSDVIAHAVRAGYTAYTVDDFLSSEHASPGSFDGLLIAHVLEHLDADAARQLLVDYLPLLKPGGRVFMICPQERGYRSDSTHVRFTTSTDLVGLAKSVGLVPEKPFSFPFPRFAGRFFIYNEFCLRAAVPHG